VWKDLMVAAGNDQLHLSPVLPALPDGFSITGLISS